MIGYLGAVFGGVIALIILFIENKRSTYFYLSPKLLRFKRSKDFPRQNFRKILKRLGLEGSLIVIYSSLLVFYQLVDSFVMKDALVKSGLGDLDAKIQKGIFDRGQPLVQLGLVVALGLTSIFLPMLTRQVRQNKMAVFHAYSGIFIRLTSALAGGATVGLIFLLPAVNFALFKDQAGFGPLSLFIASIFLVAMIQVYENILQSQNYYRGPLISAALGFFIKLTTTEFLVVRLQSVGSSLATLLGLTVTLLCLKKQTGKTLKKQLYPHFFLPKLFFSLGIMGVVLVAYQVLLGQFFLQHRLYALLFSMLGVVLGALTFVVMILWLKVFTIREWLMLPYGDKILKLFQRK